MTIKKKQSKNKSEPQTTESNNKKDNKLEAAAAKDYQKGAACSSDDGVCDFCYGLSKQTLQNIAAAKKNQQPDENNHYDVQILLVSGYNEPERATAGLLMALACATSFKKVVIFLMMDAVELAAKNPKKKVRIAPFDYMDSYIDTLISLGTKIEICSSCIQAFFPKTSDSDTLKYIRPEAHIHGMLDVALRAENAITLMF